MGFERRGVVGQQEVRLLGIIRFRVGEQPEAVTIQPGAEAIRREVAGFFAEIDLGDRVTAYVNDEGERLGLPYNRTVIDKDGTHRPIRGNFFLSIRTPKGTLVGFTDSQLLATLQRVVDGTSSYFAAQP